MNKEIELAKKERELGKKTRESTNIGLIKLKQNIKKIIEKNEKLSINIRKLELELEKIKKLK